MRFVSILRVFSWYTPVRNRHCMAKKPTFKPKKCRFFRSYRFCDFCAGAALIAGPTLDFVLKTRLSDSYRGAITFGFNVLACIMLLLKNFMEHKTQEEHDSPRHLDSFTRALLPILMAVGTNRDEPKLRICVYIPDGDGLLHVTDSVGFAVDDRKPIPRSMGIVGLAARESKLVSVSFPTKPATTVTDFFVKRFGYDRVDASKLDQQRRSWAAVPIKNGDTLEAVLYCDACTRDFFGKTGGTRHKILEAAVIGVVDFIRNR